MAIVELFLDESGYTGPDLINADQPTTMMRKIILALLVFTLAACTPKPKPTLPPPPPVIQTHPTTQNLKPRPEDIVIHNCILTREGKATVDCLCRHASTKIDSVTGDRSLECGMEKKK